MAYREKKMYPEAIAALERSLSRSGPHGLRLASLAGVYGLARRRPEALKLIDELKARARMRYVPSSLFALAYMLTTIFEVGDIIVGHPEVVRADVELLAHDSNREIPTYSGDYAL